MFEKVSGLPGSQSAQRATSLLVILLHLARTICRQHVVMKPLFTLQLIEDGLNKIRCQSELIKVSLWHLSIAITANLCAQDLIHYSICTHCCLDVS